MKRIVSITFSRAEYSSFLPVLQVFEASPDIDSRVIVSGTHLSERFGFTVEEIEKDGFQIAARIPMDLESDAPRDIAAAVGRLTAPLAGSLAELSPDLTLLIGDRLELLAPALTALSLRLPIAHVGGGDVTEGALDNQVRHAITHLSHLHFVAMEEHAERLYRMGEERWRVHVTGFPALDLLRSMPLLSRDALQRELGIELNPPVMVLTYHPTTLGIEDSGLEIGAVLDALDHVEGTLIMTIPNADAGGNAIASRLREYESRRPSVRLYESLGQLRYYSLLHHADLMIGNSSGGIWESPSFQLPVVNIGERQRGRLQAPNVINSPCRPDEILAATRRALSGTFRKSLGAIVNPYGDGRVAERMLSVLLNLPDRFRLLRKSFADSIED